MFQFGELLTLGLFLVTVVYLLVHRRTIASLATLRPLIIPFLLMALAALATVVEGIPAGAARDQIVFWEESPAVVRAGGWVSTALNLVEHVGFAAGAMGLAIVLWRRRSAGAGTER
jgi:hypothetical protein